MKPLIAIFIFLALTCPLIAGEVAPEADIQNTGSMQRKAQRGFLNIALCPFEISNELAKEVRKDTLPPSWIAGAGRGAFYMVGRALVGVYELVTFPIPYPANYQPVLKPEFPWELAENKPNF